MQLDEFAEVALSYQGPLWHAALRFTRNRIEAEDLLQETYRRAFEHAGELRQLSRCRAWLFRILTSLAIDRHRRIRRGLVIAGSAAEDASEPVVPSGWGDLEQEMLDRISTQEIEKLIKALPDEQAIALTLSDVEGFTYEEIAEVLDCPIGTVRSRIARARATLMERLSGRARMYGIGTQR